MSSMAIGVSRRQELDDLIAAENSGITSTEVASTNQLPVTLRSVESTASAFAVTSPSRRNGIKIAIGEARTLGPDPGVDDADDGVGSEAREVGEERGERGV